MIITGFLEMTKRNKAIREKFAEIESSWNSSIVGLFPKTAKTANQVHTINKLNAFPVILLDDEIEVEVLNAMVKRYEKENSKTRKRKMFLISQQLFSVDNLTIIDYKAYMNFIKEYWISRGVLLKKDGSAQLVTNGR